MFKKIDKLQKLHLILFFNIFILLNFEIIDNKEVYIITFLLLNSIYVLCNLKTFNQLLSPQYICTVEETDEYREICGKNLEVFWNKIEKIVGDD